jgi:amino acid permease
MSSQDSQPLLQALSLHTYPPPTTSPISHDIQLGITEQSVDDSAGELPGTLNGTPERKGFWLESSETQRGMQSRHITMIAISGTIGTGIFLSAAIAVATGGPGNALLSYIVLGVFIYAMMITLGEMSSMYPVSGAFSTFGTRFVSPGLGFALGWNYWLQWCLTIPSELTASAVILEFWTSRLHPWQWAIIITVPVFAFQLIHVRAYGAIILS